MSEKILIAETFRNVNGKCPDEITKKIRMIIEVCPKTEDCLKNNNYTNFNQEKKSIRSMPSYPPPLPLPPIPKKVSFGSGSKKPEEDKDDGKSLKTLRKHGEIPSNIMDNFRENYKTWNDATSFTHDNFNYKVQELAKVEKFAVFKQFEGDGVIGSSLCFENMTDCHLLYKIRGTSPPKYRVSPTIGLVGPKVKMCIFITLTKDIPIQSVMGEKFLLQFISIPEELLEKSQHLYQLNAENDRLHLFWKEFTRKKELENHSVDCKFSLLTSSNTQIQPTIPVNSGCVSNQTNERRERGRIMGNLIPDICERGSRMAIHFTYPFLGINLIFFIIMIWIQLGLMLNDDDSINIC